MVLECAIYIKSIHDIPLNKITGSNAYELNFTQHLILVRFPTGLLQSIFNTTSDCYNRSGQSHVC